MNIKFSYNTNSWGPYPDLELMWQQVKEAGWDGLEVRQPLDWLGSADRILTLAGEVGLPVNAIAWQALKHGDDVSLNINKHRIDFSAALHADLFVFAAPQRARHRPVTREESEWLAYAAKELSDYGANIGIDVAIHPHTGTIATSRKEWDPLMDASPNLKLCFDFAHILLAGDNIEPVFVDYKDRIAYVHVHDFGRWSFVNLGEGKQYDIQAALRKLDEIGYQRWVAVNGDLYSGSTQSENASICRSYLHSIGF